MVWVIQPLFNLRSRSPVGEARSWAGRWRDDNAMKTCPYCGAEYPDDAVMCTIDHTPFEEPPGFKMAEYRFRQLFAQDAERDFVTLVSCANLPAADVIVGRLEAAGIEAFIPDESMMQDLGVNAFGYVRVQIAPKDYEAARELLSDIYHA